MIYLASDDSFFTLGTEATFSAAHIVVTQIDANVTKEALSKVIFNSKDILVIAIEQADIIIDLMATARRQDAKVLLVMDNASDSTFSSIHQGVLPKKMPLEALLPLLEGDETYLQNLQRLTRQEVKIMRELTTGKTPYYLAKELNLSVKTICSHKVSALKKLGLNHLNARSMIIFGKICRGFVYF